MAVDAAENGHMCLDSRWLPNRNSPCNLAVEWQHLFVCACLSQGFVVFLLYKVCLKPPLPPRVSFCAVVRECKGKKKLTFFFVVSLLADLLINSAIMALRLCGDSFNLFTGIWCGNKLNCGCNEHTHTDTHMHTHTHTNKNLKVKYTTPNNTPKTNHVVFLSWPIMNFKLRGIFIRTLFQ